ncbi:MAG: N-acetyltransferase [Actinomycetota bacterium]|nr:N-acetyltransferase [Actinomycetota bacterium]
MIRRVLYSERPELWERIEDLSEQVWPEYNRHGDTLNQFWGRLYEVFPEFQFVLHDDDSDEVLAEGHTIPCAWDGSEDDLPEGIDAVLADAFALHERGKSPNTLCALAVEIPPHHRRRRLSPQALGAMRQIASEHGLRDLLAPLRPNWKDRYPLNPIERYARWRRDDGSLFDPWLRVHVQLGADVLKPAPRSLLITGSVGEWESWTGMAFPETGTYVFPEGLAPVEIDRDADQGRYWEPNIWVRHRVEAAGP